MATTYKRGFTPQAPSPPDKRPPRLKGGVFNEFRQAKARAAMMSPPTGDTQEPRLSRFEGAPVKGPLAKGGLSKGKRPNKDKR